MFRLLGFLIGSVSAIGVLLMLLGIPDFHLPDAADDRQRFDAAVEKLKEKQLEIAEVAEVVVDGTATAVENVMDNIEDAAANSMPEPEPELELEPEPEEQISMPIEPSPAMQETALPVAGQAPLVPQNSFDLVQSFNEELQWYSFWNPFRSELAANGFVAQLEKVTGLDYRVVKVKTGVYEVAFAYADDGERRDKLNRIALATGLDLSGS